MATLIVIGDRIKKARESRGITQKALAEGIGIKQPSLSSIESGKSEPREATLLAIARYLNDDLGEDWITLRIPKDRPQVNKVDMRIMPLLSFVRNNEFFAYIALDRLAAAAPMLRRDLEALSGRDVLDKAAKVAELVDGLDSSSGVQDLGAIDEFDIAGSIKEHDNPATVLEEWYRHDKLPTTEISVPVFAGWAEMTLEEKVSELRAFREIEERHEERIGYVSPTEASSSAEEIRTRKVHRR